MGRRPRASRSFRMRTVWSVVPQASPVDQVGVPVEQQRVSINVYLHISMVNVQHGSSCCAEQSSLKTVTGNACGTGRTSARGRSTIMKNGTCPKCGETAILSGLRVADQGDYEMVRDLQFQVHTKPRALIFKKTHVAKLAAWVCMKCGYTELYVDNPQELWAAHQQMEAEQG